MKRFEKAERLSNFHPIFLKRSIERKRKSGQEEWISLTWEWVIRIFLPPEPIVRALKKAVDDPANHRYPSYSGLNTFKETVAEWYRKRFGVVLDASTEVVSLIGSKEGIAHFPLAFINPGDVALVPSPAYPVYNIATIFAGGESFFMPLLSENGFLPELKSIPKEVAEQAKIMFLNYPNNPTSAIAGLDFFRQVVDFARKYDILVCHDAAYTEMSFDGYRAPSFLEVEGAKDVCIEFHSLSKTYNMTGWRIGFAVGNPIAVEGLGAIKSNIDSGVFQAIQLAGIEAIKGDQACVEEANRIYTERRDLMVGGLRDSGFDGGYPQSHFLSLDKGS